MITPKEVLQEQLYKHQKALSKSKEALRTGQITPELHRIHRTNNEPQIDLFEAAIRVLIENNIP